MQICTIIIVNYNTLQITSSCLDSIIQFCPLDIYKLVVVDNNSIDGSYEGLSKNYPDVEIIKLNKNRGYGAALNVGLQKCDTEFVLFLNSDILFVNSSIENGLTLLKERPDIAVCGALNLKKNKEAGASYGDFPFLWTILCINLHLGWFFPFFSSTKKSMGYVPSQFDSIVEVDFPIGSFLLTRTKLAKDINGFDEKFFLYFEETDFIYKIKEYGKVVYNPFIEVIHLGGESTHLNGTNINKHFYKSWGIFLRKHRGFFYSILVKYTLLLIYIFHYIVIGLCFSNNSKMYRQRINILISEW